MMSSGQKKPEFKDLHPVERLQYFVGKPVTVLTHRVHRDFQGEAVSMGNPKMYPTNVLDLFLGIVEYVDEWGLMTIHPQSKLKSFFPHHNIVGIVEEQVIEDPELAKKIREQQQQKIKAIQNEPPKTSSTSGFIDPEKLKLQAEEAKKRFSN